MIFTLVYFTPEISYSATNHELKFYIICIKYYLLIITRCICKTRDITLKTIVYAPFYLKLVSRMMAPDMSTGTACGGHVFINIFIDMRIIVRYIMLIVWCAYSTLVVSFMITVCLGNICILPSLNKMSNVSLNRKRKYFNILYAVSNRISFLLHALYGGLFLHKITNEISRKCWK